MDLHRFKNLIKIHKDYLVKYVEVVNKPLLYTVVFNWQLYVLVLLFFLFSTLANLEFVIRQHRWIHNGLFQNNERKLLRRNKINVVTVSRSTCNRARLSHLYSVKGELVYELVLDYTFSLILFRWYINIYYYVFINNIFDCSVSFLCTFSYLFRNEKFYTCCDEPYLDITFNITMRRKQANKNHKLFILKRGGISITNLFLHPIPLIICIYSAVLLS